MSRSPECDPSSSAQAAGRIYPGGPDIIKLGGSCQSFSWTGHDMETCVDRVMMGDDPPSASAGPEPLGLNAVTSARGGRAAKTMLSL